MTAQTACMSSQTLHDIASVDARPPDDGDRFAAEQPEPPEPLVRILTRRPVTASEGLLAAYTIFDKLPRPMLAPVVHRTPA